MSLKSQISLSPSALLEKKRKMINSFYYEILNITSGKSMLSLAVLYTRCAGHLVGNIFAFSLITSSQAEGGLSKFIFTLSAKYAGR